MDIETLITGFFISCPKRALWREVPDLQADRARNFIRLALTKGSSVSDIEPEASRLFRRNRQGHPSIDRGFWNQRGANCIGSTG